ncbi:hypothetical protein JCM11251_001557 [Rhodosporidiobolus azoricus]
MSLSDLKLSDVGGPTPSSSGANSPTSPRSRSQSPGLLGMFGLAQPTLEVSLFPRAREDFFLHPNPTVGAPTEDETVTGHVRLWLPKPRTLKDLTVTLVGQYDIGWPDSSRPYESGKFLERTVSLVQGSEGLKLEKGEHTFEFVFVIPDNSACYTRCRFGRIRHYITARARGINKAGSDLVSNDKPIYCIANPGVNGISRPPPPLFLKFDGNEDELGIYTLALQSQHIMVGGLLLLRLSLPFPSSDVLIFSITVKILQQFTLRSPLEDHYTSTPSPSPQTVMILDSAHPPNNARMQDEGRGEQPSARPCLDRPLKALKKDEMWNIIHLARLPNDNYIRPSTPDGTDTPIAIHHTLLCEITYRPMSEGESNPMPASTKGKGKEKEEKKQRDPKPEMKKLTVSRPFDLWSCCCFLDSLTLPVYSELDPISSSIETEPEATTIPCVCLLSLKRLIKSQANALLVEGDTPLQVEYVPPRKTDSQLSSPAPSSPATPTMDRPPGTRQDSGASSSFASLDEQGRGRSTSRRSSPAASREPSLRSFFRFGGSSDHGFALTGYRAPAPPS